MKVGNLRIELSVRILADGEELVSNEMETEFPCDLDQLDKDIRTHVDTFVRPLEFAARVLVKRMEDDMPEGFSHKPNWPKEQAVPKEEMERLKNILQATDFA
jgi:hypothetical protein